MMFTSSRKNDQSPAPAGYKTGDRGALRPVAQAVD